MHVAAVFSEANLCNAACYGEFVKLSWFLRQHGGVKWTDYITEGYCEKSAPQKKEKTRKTKYPQMSSK